MNDDRLDDYKRRLEKAINESLSESPSINSLIHEIQDTGFDVFLIVEATIGFDKQSDEEAEEGSKTRQGSKVKLKLTSQDERFLRQLKISPD